MKDEGRHRRHRRHPGRRGLRGMPDARAWGRRWRHSLRARLIGAFVLLAITMSVVFLGGMQRAFSVGWRDAARPLVADYVDRVVAEIGTPPDIERARAITQRLPLSIRIDGPVVHWDSHPELDREDGRRFLRRANDWFSRTTADGHRISFGLGSLPWRSAPHGIGAATLAVLLVLTLAAYAYLRRQLRPLDDIRAGAERFGRGDFDQPIPLRRRDELGDLALRINTMAQDIKGMLDAKRGLLLALSHELRSPLTRARLNAELLPIPEGGAAAGAAERDALLRDLNLMRDLISDLLESERLASPHAALHREPVDLAALVRATAAELGAAAAPDLVLDLTDGLGSAELDRARMRLLVRNLLDNALRHGAGAAQPPRVSLRTEPGGALLLSVRDHGPGVDDAQLERLTEPFYRTDGARARATGGVGLGLYLCRLVAQAHGGSLDAHNAHPGLRIDVRLPLRVGASA